MNTLLGFISRVETASHSPLSPPEDARALRCSDGLDDDELSPYLDESNLGGITLLSDTRDLSAEAVVGVMKR